MERMKIENVEISKRNAKRNIKMTTVYADVTAPLYWWKEFYSFKSDIVDCDYDMVAVGKDFTIDDFAHQHMGDMELELLEKTIALLNYQKRMYAQTGDIGWKLKLIQTLPMSYMLKGTAMVNYGLLTSIYFTNRYSFLNEWTEFCEWIRSLPQGEAICRDRRK